MVPPRAAKARARTRLRTGRCRAGRGEEPLSPPAEIWFDAAMTHTMIDWREPDPLAAAWWSIMAARTVSAGVAVLLLAACQPGGANDRAAPSPAGDGAIPDPA